MKLEEIHEAWAVDSKVDVDPTVLIVQSGQVPYLHAKYSKILSQERMRYKAMELEHKRLMLDLYEYLCTPNAFTDEQYEERKWPPRQKNAVLKTEFDTYSQAHPDYANSIKLLSLQKEKIDVLEGIIKTINNRQFLIKNIIDLHKFNNGLS
jgi:hypothetical protein